jgi:hypothetical protein
MKFIFLLSALTLAFATDLQPRANNLVPTVDPTVYLPDGGSGTYPRLTHLVDGSVLGAVSTVKNGTKILTVTRSTDGARTFSTWGTVATGTGDLTNLVLIQLANGDVIAAARNHDKSGGTYTKYRVRGYYLDSARALTNSHLIDYGLHLTR